MKIIAETKEGFLINASKEEVNAVLTSTNGVLQTKDSIETGQKIPKIDYASTISKVNH